MATSIQQIAGYLDQRGWRYDYDADQSHVITGVQAENVEQFLIVIRVGEDGEYVEFVALQLLKVKDHVFKGVVFQTLLAIAWEVKLLRWQYDPSDGEVRASIAVAVEDGSFTRRQFDRCLEAMIQLVDQVAMPRLLAVLATGDDPGQRSMEQSLAELLQGQLSQEELAVLQQTIAQLQASDETR
jgi:Putative bacterial sensory transduction regulator